MRKMIRRLPTRIVGNQDGFLLVAALTLLSVLILVGGTAVLLSSTDLKIAANFRQTESALQVAMAAVEAGRQNLRVLNRDSTDKTSFSDELAGFVGANSVLNGYATATDDVTLASGTLNGISYVVYATNDAQDANGQYGTTDANKRALITAVATASSGAKARVETVVRVVDMISAPATVYTKGDVTGNGGSLSIDGTDACGQSAPLGAVYAKGDWDPNGSPTITGDVTEYGNVDLDIAGMIAKLKPAADVTLTEDAQNTTYGSDDSYKIVYSNTSSPANVNGLNLSNLQGYGILIVDGDLELGGGFNWHGMILVTGAVRLNGGGGQQALNISGQLLSGTSTVTDISLNGTNNIQYDSCGIKKATAAAPLTVLSWKQAY